MEIGLHNELSYTRSWPERVFFCCLVAADSGGETHIADSRRVFTQMTRQFAIVFRRGVIYRQHLRMATASPAPASLAGKLSTRPIATTNGTYLPQSAHGLPMDQSRPSHDAQQPRRVEPSNHRRDLLVQPGRHVARQFDTVKAQESPRAVKGSGEQTLGSHACYGDGSEIPIADLEAVRSACRKSEVLFSWQAGDFVDSRQRPRHARPQALQGRT